MAIAKLIRYSYIIKFLTIQKKLIGLPRDERKKMRVNGRYFVVIENWLYWKGVEGILYRCVTSKEIPTILVACHDSICGGYFFNQLTG